MNKPSIRGMDTMCFRHFNELETDTDMIMETGISTMINKPSEQKTSNRTRRAIKQKRREIIIIIIIMHI